MTGDPKKATKKDRRKGNVSPHGLYATPKAAKAKKAKKPKTVNYRTKGKGTGMLKVGFGKGRRTSKSCRQ